MKPAAPTNFKFNNPPDYDEILKCTHCGLCLNQCPTYRVLGWEMDSPRGRIRFMRSVTEGLQQVTPVFSRHMDICLACRACQSACPATINFGEMVEAARAQALQALPQKPLGRFMRWALLKQLFRHPGRLNFFAGLLRLYQRSGMQWLARKLHLIPSAVRDSEALLPPLPSQFYAVGRVAPARGTKRGTVAMFSGCVMGTVYADTDRATERVLARNGFEVVIPRGQLCCGAIAIHSGERALAKEMARQNVDAFLTADLQAVIVNAAGCGLALKEYRDLLQDDPEYAEKAQQLSAKIKDVSEFLASAGIEKPTREIRARITYQDPCHLAHGQSVRAQPRALLAQIPGVELIEMKDSDRCCGSAGIYNITHPDIAMQVLDEKMGNVQATRPEIIVTANAGCLLQLQLGAKRAGISERVQVLHVMDLLDRAYGD